MEDFDQIANEYEEEYIPKVFERTLPDAGTYNLMRIDEGFKAGVKTNAKIGKFAWFIFKARIIKEDGGLGAFVNGAINTGVWNTTHPFSSVRDFQESAGNPVKLKASELIAELEAQGDTKNPTSALLQIEGPFTAYVDHEWRCVTCAKADRDKGTFLRGQKNPKAPPKYNGAKATIAKGENGKAARTQTCPNCQKEVNASLEIRDFVVKAKAAPAQQNQEVAG